MDKSTVSKVLLDIQAVTLRPKEPFTFVSGIKSPIYCDNRLILSYPEKRDAIVASFLALIKEHKLEFDVIAGVATSGIPFATLLADRLKKPMVYVRADAKKHGKQNQVEGKVEHGKKALVVEDLVSTGSSSLAAVDALREAGMQVDDCIAIFSYAFSKATESFNEQNCRLYTLSDFPTLVRQAADQGYLEQEALQHVLSWSRNPEQWQL